MKISVIIPTYTRPQSLLQTLCSLQEQTLANFEIIVVDNAADSDVERMATEFNHAATVPVRYMPEPQLGAHNARHTGAHAAEGDILVFADDDETFAPEWLGAYARAFAEHPEMAAAGGPIRLVWEAPPPAWLLEFMGHARTFIILGLLDASDEFCLSPKGGFFSGNMAIRRDVFFQLGGFNPDQVGAFLLGECSRGNYLPSYPSTKDDSEVLPTPYGKRRRSRGVHAFSRGRAWLVSSRQTRGRNCNQER